MQPGAVKRLAMRDDVKPHGPSLHHIQPEIGWLSDDGKICPQLPSRAPNLFTPSKRLPDPPFFPVLSFKYMIFVHQSKKEHIFSRKARKLAVQKT
jgi:hypothetical protein